MPPGQSPQELILQEGFELSEQEVWDMEILTEAASLQTRNMTGTTPTAATAFWRIPTLAVLSECNQQSETLSSFALLTSKYPSTSTNLGISSAQLVIGMEAAGSRGQKGICAAASAWNMTMRKKPSAKDGAHDEDDEDSSAGEKAGMGMKPPHLIISNRGKATMASSVMEGVGRTLKGRDLRNFRNTMWKRTGFSG